MNENIEISQSSRFSKTDSVDVFEPFYQKSRVKLKVQTSLVDRFGLNIKRNNALLGDIDDMII